MAVRMAQPVIKTNVKSNVSRFILNLLLTKDCCLALNERKKSGPERRRSTIDIESHRNGEQLMLSQLAMQRPAYEAGRRNFNREASLEPRDSRTASKS
jgi:hypothetical protein